MPPAAADAVVPGRPGRLRFALARLRARGRLQVGRGVRVERGARISVAPGARVVLEEGCLIGERARIEAEAGTVRIGCGTRVGERALLVALAGIDVGAECVIGDWALVADAEPAFGGAERLEAVPVVIGDGARLGAHAAVLAGARVPPRAVVGSYEVRTPPASSS